MSLMKTIIELNALTRRVEELESIIAHFATDEPGKYRAEHYGGAKFGVVDFMGRRVPVEGRAFEYMDKATATAEAERMSEA